jgi:hypothetical protein
VPADNPLKKLSPSFYALTSGRSSLNIAQHIDASSLDSFLKDLSGVVQVLSNNGAELAEAAATAVKFNIYMRAVQHKENMGVMETLYGSSWYQQEQKNSWDTVLDIIIRSKPTVTISKPGYTKVGFIDRAELDSVRLIERIGARPKKADGVVSREKVSMKQSTPSEFNILWLIGEFGTGIYASPESMKRTEGEYKIKGAGGAWFTSAGGRGPKIKGQEGGHFLFPYRSNFDAITQDLTAARNAVNERIGLLLQSLVK